jgi:predicted transcriptional regulator
MMATTTTTEQLRGWRRALGISQRELARRAGYSLTHIANVEAGVVPRRSPVLEQIDAVLSAAERERAKNASRPACQPDATTNEGIPGADAAP